MSTPPMYRPPVLMVFVLSLMALACSSESEETLSQDQSLTTLSAGQGQDSATETLSQDRDSESALAAQTETGSRSYLIEVWADNWMAVYVDGVLIGEDSVPITTERSFNAEKFTFDADIPFTVAIEAKDFKETESGIEYIGKRNQQMGDGGLIAQISDTQTGETVASTNGDWVTLVTQRAPLNKDCEKSSDPDAECLVEAIPAPQGWTDPDFDDSRWIPATVWTADDVGPKDGYDDISWGPEAELVWGSDLEQDNTILFRNTISPDR